MTKVQRLGYADYETYLASEQWKERREAFARHRSPRCFVCGRTKKCHLHHKTYENLGNEGDDDLEWLCKQHHEEVHDRGEISVPPLQKLAEMRAAWESRSGKQRAPKVKKIKKPLRKYVTATQARELSEYGMPIEEARLVTVKEYGGVKHRLFIAYRRSMERKH